ncbi:DNA helicase mcm9 [Mortierella polycephala]|uniref:DNA helicase n=1 Tax=Mortierella polycephala TaxID=41804 RepID=A0A9P6PP11_9FUNG|nr:DNA helicase mcm9 [Mortierella polycephala]
MVPLESNSVELFRASLTQGILERHYEEICDILFAVDTTQHYSVVIDIMALVDSASDSRLWSQLAVSPHTVLPILDSILQDVQLELIKMNDEDPGDRNHQDEDKPEIRRQRRAPMCLKPKCSARVMGLPAAESRRMTIPTSMDVGTFLSITATVIRTGVVKMLENSKMALCLTCKQTFEVLADVEQYNQVVIPARCQAKNNARPCLGNRFQMIETAPGQMPEGCRDYQEIKIQEQTNKLTMGTIPGSMVVILHDDLVDHAKSGDDATITGTVIRRWKTTIPGERCDIELALLANHVFIHNEQRVGVGITEEQRIEFEQFWDHARSSVVNKPFTARNKILSQICPKVYGLYIVKLAVMLVLTGGIQKVDKSGLKVRGEPHLLLVGDPGTGKSQFLKYAAELNPRSVLTTGIGSSSAGLTVTAVRDGNEWQLEAGALVLADRGLCCIDEFGGMREHDKVAIHEAMEQQSISIAKAGIVCKLNTRCSVIAATNPKGKYDPDQSVSINIALASPLLSRFDLVLVLMDTGNVNWDQKISSFILDTRMKVDGFLPNKRKMLSRKEIQKRRKQLKRMRRQRELEEHGEDVDAQEYDDGPDSDNIAGVDDDNESNDDHDNQEDEDHGEPWTLDRLKAYLVWIKTTFEPKLTPPAEQVLVSYYQLQRKADIRNAARTTIRLLESLIRLSQAHAKLMAQDQVLVQDAVVIVSLMEATAQGGAAMLGGINPLHASFPKNAEEEYSRQEEAMLGRLGLSHLASRPDSKMDSALNSENEVRSQEEGEFPVMAGLLQQRQRVNNARRMAANEEHEGTSSSSMILDDQAEAALLARFRREDSHIDNSIADGSEGLVDVKEEPPLIDRRASRRQENETRVSNKGKGVSKEYMNHPRPQDSVQDVGTGAQDDDDDSEFDDEPCPRLQSSFQGSIEL